MFTGFACLLDLTFLSWGEVIEGGDASVGDDVADGDPGGGEISGYAGVWEDELVGAEARVGGEVLGLTRCGSKDCCRMVK